MKPRREGRRRWPVPALLALAFVAGLAPAAMAAGPPPAEARTDLAAEIEGFLGTEWFGLYLNGQKCGYAAGSMMRAERRAVVLMTMHLKVTAMGRGQSIRVVERREYDLADGALAGVRQTMLTGGTSISYAGRVEGESLVFEETVSGRTTTKRLAAPNENLRDHLASQRLVRGGAKKGARVESRMFDATTQRVLTMQNELLGWEELVLGGVPTRVARVSVTVPEMPALSQRAVVDAEGRILESEMEMGGLRLRLRSEPRALARKFSYSKDILVSTVAPVDRPIEGSGRVRRLVARVSGMPEGQTLFRGGRLAWKEEAGGVWTLTSSVDAPPGPSKLPKELPEEVRGSVRPTAFIQSDAEEVRKLAAEIAGGEEDPYRAAAAINRWVYANVRKVFTPAASNALDTLRSRRGDCGEHAVLAVALCRARGVPAREVAGLAYWPPGRGFGGHAWFEVYVPDKRAPGGGRWVALDPAFGQPIADATHIKFAEGGFSEAASMLQMTPIIGALKFEIVEVER